MTNEPLERLQEGVYVDTATHELHLSLSELFVRFGVDEIDTPANRRLFQAGVERGLAKVFPGWPVHWDVG
jgi:hypothetical protein